MKIGVISGHKIPNLLKNPDKINVETPFGTVQVEVSKQDKNEIFYISRHGKESNLPPHKVNYLANIQAFSSSHVDFIFSVGTVGSLNEKIQPGDFVIPHDFIDFTKSRNMTFFNDKRVHVDMSNPFCKTLRTSLISSCKNLKDIKFYEKGVYLTTEGPRLETVSEIKLFSNHADIVGMTLAPEVILAREKGICFGSLCVVCNMAAGLQNRLTADEISKIYQTRETHIYKILKSTIDSIEKTDNCECKTYILKASL